MFPQIDQKQLKRVQEVSKNIRGVITVNYKEGSINIKLNPGTPEAEQFIKVSMLPQFSEAMATQLETFFAITGEIIDVGKK